MQMAGAGVAKNALLVVFIGLVPKSGTDCFLYKFRELDGIDARLGGYGYKER